MMLKVEEFLRYGSQLAKSDAELNIKSLGDYIIKHGQKRVEGYVSAIFEFRKRITPILNRQLVNDTYAPNSPSFVRRELEKYYQEQIGFHASPIADFIRSNDSEWPKGYLDFTSDLIKGLYLVLETELEDGGSYPNTGIHVTRKLEKLVEQKTAFSDAIQQIVIVNSKSAVSKNKTNLQP